MQLLKTRQTESGALWKEFCTRPNMIGETKAVQAAPQKRVAEYKPQSIAPSRLISVITPVYNVEEYLCECIDSILKQRMTDFELLLIDDGSKDSSGAICDYFAAHDSRIRVFHTPNRGVSSARNLGLDEARGEFVVFVDSDDRVEPDHLLQFIQSGIGEDGIAFTNLIEERPARGERKPHNRIYPIPDYYAAGGRRACMPVIARLLRTHSFGWTCNKMFSRATIERYKLRFDRNIRYAEDEIFTAQYCAHITHIVCNSHPTYYYRYVPTSLLRGRIDPMMLMRVRLYINEQYKALGYCDEILYLTARTQFSRLRRELRHASWNAELANELAQGILDNWQLYRKHVRAEFRRGFYDIKAFWLARLCCIPDSRFWVKLVIKGLHL